MLKITIPAIDCLNDETQEFTSFKGQTLQLEHSLVSLSKWESRWLKPFLTKDEKTMPESIDYVRCMTVTPNVDPDCYKYLTNENLTDVHNYIEAAMTATTFSDEAGRANREIITSELIYYWMIAMNIPFDCQKWHLNRLLTLVKVCSVKNAPPKKMGKKEVAQRNAALNAARRNAMNSGG